MGQLASNLSPKTIVSAVIVWFVCVLLAMMVEDGGFLLGFYLIASVLFWSGSVVYFRSHRYVWPSDPWSFRLGPLLLLLLGFVGEIFVTIVRG